jgi:hypothetical protein
MQRKLLQDALRAAEWGWGWGRGIVHAWKTENSSTSMHHEKLLYWDGVFILMPIKYCTHGTLSSHTPNIY